MVHGRRELAFPAQHVGQRVVRQGVAWSCIDRILSIPRHLLKVPQRLRNGRRLPAQQEHGIQPALSLCLGDDTVKQAKRLAVLSVSGENVTAPQDLLYNLQRRQSGSPVAQLSRERDRNH